MDIIAKYGSFIKEQLEYNERSSYKYQKDEKRSQSYLQRAAMFRQMLADLQALPATTPDATAPSADGINEAALRLTQSEIKDLPEELLKELSLTESDKKDFLVTEIIDELGGVTSVDKILVGIYKRTSEIEKRTRLVARLYRMTGKGLVYAHPVRKGVYSTRPFAAENLQVPLFEDGQQPEDVQDLI